MNIFLLYVRIISKVLMTLLGFDAIFDVEYYWKNKWFSSENDSLYFEM